MSDPKQPINLIVPTPDEAEQLRKLGVRLPGVSPQAADPRSNTDYVENRLLAVGYGIYIGGYLLFCDGVESPLLVPESFVDLTQMNAAPNSMAVYGDYDSAMAPIPYGPPAPAQPIPYNYYWAAGGRANHLIVPTLFCPATTPNAVATMLSVRRELADYVQRQLVGIAIGIAGGLLLRAVFAAVGRVASRPRSVMPAIMRIRPVNGTVNVGGGFEGTPNAWTNLNPFVEGTGGPAAASGVPNLVRARFEDMGEIFETGSVRQVISHRLPADTVNWPQAARAAYRVMGSGGRLHMNVWTRSAQQVQEIIDTLTRAGFRQVVNETGYVGPGTVIGAVKP